MCKEKFDLEKFALFAGDRVELLNILSMYKMLGYKWRNGSFIRPQVDTSGTSKDFGKFSIGVTYGSIACKYNESWAEMGKLCIKYSRFIELYGVDINKQLHKELFPMSRENIEQSSTIDSVNTIAMTLGNGFSWVSSPDFSANGNIQGWNIPIEERSAVVITISKAKEWYKDGGGLREIALQAFSEDQLKDKEILTWDDLNSAPGDCFHTEAFTLPCTSNHTKSMEAFAKLSHLLAIYNGADFKFDGTNIKNQAVIVNVKGVAMVNSATSYVRFLTFKDHSTAEKFLKNNLQLINEYYMID